MLLVLNDDGARAKNRPRRKKRFKIVRLGTERREFLRSPDILAQSSYRGVMQAAFFNSFKQKVRPASISRLLLLRRKSFCFSFSQTPNCQNYIHTPRARTERKSNLRKTHESNYFCKEHTRSALTFPHLDAPTKHWRRHHVVFEQQRPNCWYVCALCSFGFRGPESENDL
jgi:hypothetical protein